MYTLMINICPLCGQVVFGMKSSVRGNCPVCRNSWKLLPQDKIEVRHSR